MAAPSYPDVASPAGGLPEDRSRVLSRAVSWLGRRKLEVGLFLLGGLLRATMVWRYDPGWSYDAFGHWEVVEWILEHGRVPPVEATFHSFHPPLYYASAAWLVSHGISQVNVVWLSVACGTLRLGLIWAGLELYLPTSRLARLFALALAAVLASSVHPDGMNYPEAMNGMWITAALLLVPLAFRRAPRTRWRFTGAIGLLLGLAMLTKVSGMAIIGAIGVAALLELVFSGRDWSTRFKDLLAWAGMLAVCGAICGWYYARNVRDYGRPFVTSFELSTQRFLVEGVDHVPYLDRRSLGFFLGWTPAIHVWPYRPIGIDASPRFFPVAVASSFVDYWNYSFSGLAPNKASPMRVNNARPMSKKVLAASQYAVTGGTLIFLATVGAWFAATHRLFRRREFGLLGLMLVPLITLLAAVHFAVVYPVDSHGVVKGVYMQFGAPPMYALFGVAVLWAQQKSWRWPLFSALCVALWLVAAYTLYCRLRFQILPLG
jgi:4-amino-4-deoxy-L-arabinose transferase-like glycosyltransferase